MNVLNSGPTRVIGHRGSPRRALENTLESFDFAEMEGADGIELDIRLTFDGEAVAHHDAELLRGDRRVSVASLPLLELRQETVRRGDLSGTVPTLREIFLRYDGQILYLVELKAGPSPRPSLLEFRTAALITQFHLLNKALVLSFSPESLRRIKEIEPLVETCLLFDGTAYRPEGQLWPDLPKGCAAIAPNTPLVSERLFSSARAAGLAVHVWTVNEPGDAARYAELGAATVISDVPGLIVPAVRGVTGTVPTSSAGGALAPENGG